MKSLQEYLESLVAVGNILGLYAALHLRYIIVLISFINSKYNYTNMHKMLLYSLISRWYILVYDLQ
jgi:hypothetical protein